MGARGPALTVLAALVATACATSAPAVARATPEASACRPGPAEAGVHNPDRLQVLDPCRHAAGIVVDVAHEDDGDYHLWFTPDPGFEGLLNSENHFQGRPAMLAEIVPACPLSSNPPDAEAAAKCPRSGLPVPALGMHIDVHGPWVLDADHGWREIHPIDSIAISSTG